MSGTLTITVGNLTSPNTNVEFTFTGSGTCTTTISNGVGQPQTLRTLNGVMSCLVPASGTNQTITISDVTIGATSFAITTNADNVISVSTLSLIHI